MIVSKFIFKFAEYPFWFDKNFNNLAGSNLQSYKCRNVEVVLF